MESNPIAPSTGPTITSRIRSWFESESPEEVLRQISDRKAAILSILARASPNEIADIPRRASELEKLHIRYCAYESDKNISSKACKDLLSEVDALFEEVQGAWVRAQFAYAKRVQAEGILAANSSDAGAEVPSPFPTPPAALPPPAETPSDASDPSVGVSVKVGPIAWGSDVAGEVRALIQLLPGGYAGSQHFSAQIDAEDKNFALVHFTSATDAISFDNSWTRCPQLVLSKP
ncbi:hypothetical protein BD779DRAFT_1477624 [Infundibulicybe gibba]|nr:hypothetical protein BD779DRAFT_1477624 [Infundibulicybe gibba]